MSESAGGVACGEAAVGAVARVTIYPVKSLAGWTVPEAVAGPAGLEGDRAQVVVDAATGDPVRAKVAPGMAAVAATGDGVADAATLAGVLGRPVRLEPGQGAPPDSAVHLVSGAAIARAAVGDVPEGCSAEDPRANLLLDLHPGQDERGWVGRTLRIGDAELVVTRTPKHCLGVYAAVRTPGRVRVGDPVRLSDG